SKHWAEFVLDERLEPTRRTFDTHSLIALPCTGRLDLVPEFIDWLGQDEIAPIPQVYFRRWVDRVFWEAPSASPSVPKARTSAPSTAGSSQAWQVLTNTDDKPRAAMAAAQVALQWYGPEATTEDALK